MENDLQSLLSTLRDRSIRVRAEGDSLRVTGPPGSLTPELRSEVERLKPSLLTRLSPDRTESGLPPARPAGGEPRISYSQRDLWRRVEAGARPASFHVPRAVRLRGLLDPVRIESALRAVIGRHPALRSTVTGGPEGPRLRVGDGSAFTLERHDLSGTDRARAEEEIRALVDRDSNAPFAFDRDGLIRATLVKLAPEEWVLAVTAHHLIADCWSMGFAYQSVQDPSDLWHPGLFFEGVFAHYAGGEAEPPPRSGEPDFATWQDDFRGSALWDRQFRFWKPFWESPPERPLFDLDPRADRCSGQRRPFTVPAALSEQLRAAARRQSVSLHALLLTAFQTLLSRWRGTGDIPVGMPVSNRRLPAFQSTIGNLGNNVVLRHRMADDQSFGDAARQIQGHLADAWDHQEFPIEVLRDAFDPAHSRPQARLLMHSPRHPRDPVPGLEVFPIPLSRGLSKYPLSLIVVEQPAGLRGWGEFLDAVLTPDAFDQLVEAFLRTARLGAESPGRKLGEFPSPDR